MQEYLFLVVFIYQYITLTSLFLRCNQLPFVLILYQWARSITCVAGDASFQWAYYDLRYQKAMESVTGAIGLEVSPASQGMPASKEHTMALGIRRP